MPDLDHLEVEGVEAQIHLLARQVAGHLVGIAEHADAAGLIDLAALLPEKDLCKLGHGKTAHGSLAGGGHLQGGAPGCPMLAHMVVAIQPGDQAAVQLFQVGDPSLFDLFVGLGLEAGVDESEKPLDAPAPFWFVRPAVREADTKPAADPDEVVGREGRAVVTVELFA